MSSGHRVTWITSTAQVKDFHDREGRWPKVRAQSPAEQTLGSWLSDQRLRERRGDQKFLEERRAHLDAVIPGWRDDTNDGAWSRAAAQLRDHVTEHHTWPSAYNTDPGQQFLGSWLGRQRTAARNGTLSEYRHTILDDTAPGWRGADTWLATAQEVAAFRTLENRWPLKNAADPEEKRLGIWLNEIRHEDRHASPRLTPERRAHLTRLIPDWKESSRDGIWLAAAHAVRDFRAEHGRRPRMTGGPEERRLTLWIRQQKNAAKIGAPSLTEERRAILNDVVPGWDRVFGPRHPKP